MNPYIYFNNDYLKSGLISTQTIKFLSVEPLLEDLGDVDFSGLDWIIVGGESGPKARPMQKEWAIHIKNQCENNELTKIATFRNKYLSACDGNSTDRIFKAILKFSSNPCKRRNISFFTIRQAPVTADTF